MLAFALALAPVHQKYLLEARQMQALSFTVHIPLVCFGIAFPVMVMFVEWLGIRTGDPLYRTLARRWSRIIVALFAVGVITGTILSFEMGLLWPNFMATFGSVFGLGFAIEGFSFFLEAIFIGIYAYGWNKLSPRWHLVSGIPVVLTGFTGSLMVIAVNAWMNHPTGFRLAGGKVTHVNPLQALFGNPYLWSELIHMYVAAYMVTGFIVAGCYAFAKLRGNWSRYHRVALTIPLTIACLAAPMQVLVGDWLARDVAVSQPVKLAAFEGLYKTTDGADEHILGWYTHDQVKDGIAFPHLLSLLAFHSWNARMIGLQSVPANSRPTAINVVRFSFQIMVLRRLGAGGARRPVSARPLATRAAAGHGVVLPRGRARGPGGVRVPDRRLGYDRGRPPAVGRLPGDAHLAGGHRRGRHPGRLRGARRRLRGGRDRGRLDPATAGAQAAGARPGRHRPHARPPSAHHPRPAPQAA